MYNRQRIGFVDELRRLQSGVCVHNDNDTDKQLLLLLLLLLPIELDAATIVIVVAAVAVERMRIIDDNEAARRFLLNCTVLADA